MSNCRFDFPKERAEFDGHDQDVLEAVDVILDVHLLPKGLRRATPLARDAYEAAN